MGETPVTAAMLEDVVIVASTSRRTLRPHLCAVAHINGKGKRTVLKDDLNDRSAAERWIERKRVELGLRVSTNGPLEGEGRYVTEVSEEGEDHWSWLT